MSAEAPSRAAQRLFRWYQRRHPALDAERVWARLDLESPAPGELTLEARLVADLAPHRAALAAAMLLIFGLGVSLVWGLGPRLVAALSARGGFAAATGWALVPFFAGFVVHGLFILVVHEATHHNILQNRFDRSLGNIALGLLFLPFLAERYQHTHRVHHRWVNTAHDNNWTAFRDKLSQRARVLYVVYELIPILNNVDRLAERVPVRRLQAALAWGVALCAALFFRPPVTYWLLVLFWLNFVNANRLWVEHFGHYRGALANTYSAPLSFGIGHHALHHRDPRVPAMVLMVGLWFRRKDLSLRHGLYRLLRRRDWAHFRTQQPDFAPSTAEASAGPARPPETRAAARGRDSTGGA